MSGQSSISSYFSRLPIRVLVCWIVVLCLGYYFSFPNATLTKEEHLLHPNGPVAYHTQAAILQRRTKEFFPQAIVFIVMGNLARESLVEDAMLSVRLLGRWEEKIIVLTDRKGCFSDSQYWTVIEVPSKPSLIEIKAMKAEIFQYLPVDIHRVLYMDVDILVTRNLGFFLQDLSHMMYHKFSSSSKSLSPSNETYSLLSHNDSTAFSMAAFLDAKGHYVGFCSGCEKWHSGVVYLVRNFGSNCLAAWASVLRSGRFNTDQESLDYVENYGNCSQMVALPSRHLLFAKDYIGMVFTSGQTFVHLTSVNRMDNTDYFYKDWVVPRIRNSLHPPLKPYTESTQKTC